MEKLRCWATLNEKTIHETCIVVTLERMIWLPLSVSASKESVIPS